MPTIRLRNWQDIKDDYSDGLLLGNGASIAIDPRFAYSSLLEVGRRQRIITPAVNHVFGEFGISDFELVLNALWLVSQSMV